MGQGFSFENGIKRTVADHLSVDPDTTNNFMLGQLCKEAGNYCIKFLGGLEKNMESNGSISTPEQALDTCFNLYLSSRKVGLSDDKLNSFKAAIENFALRNKEDILKERNLLYSKSGHYLGSRP